MDKAALSKIIWPDSATKNDRIHFLHEAICRCATCRGTLDKTKLCRVCAAHQDEIEKLKTVPLAPYGFCPICGAPGVLRERRPDGNDRCNQGHTYPSRSSVGEVAP